MESGLAVQRNGTTSVLSSIVLLITSNTLQAITQVDIPPRDTDAFIEAVSSANDSEDTWIIKLASNSGYRFNLPAQSLEPIEGHLIIEGNNSQLLGEGTPGFGQLFLVESAAVLELSNLVVRSFNSGEEFATNDLNGLIHVEVDGALIGEDLRFEKLRVDLEGGTNGAVITNEGQLSLNRVRFTDIVSGPTRAIAVYNFGDTHIRNALFADSFEMDPNNPSFGGVYVATTGGVLNLVIEYSTFIAHSDLSETTKDLFSVAREGGLGATPEATVQGTLVIGMRCPDATSLGFNLFTDELCSLDGTADQVGISAEPLFIANDDGLVIIPEKGSKALDKGNRAKSKCPSDDLLRTRRPQDGKGNGVSRCDIGAFEKMEGSPLFSGGENGLFHDSSQDGHFVTIQEVRPNEYVIFWTAFDLDGNQSWILAIGELDDDTISGEAFFVPEGMLIPGGGAEVDASEMQNWGSVKIELSDCSSGTFEYSSKLSQFGSGSFPLDRLANVSGLGCHSP